ncbi:MAG: hypothetical protein LBS50_05510 [Prevotellaceae bacterium]|nr:hypothetical protein [Prevotellaceae bacterium]
MIEKDWSPQQIVGKNNRGAIVTVVERKTNFLLMEKLEHSKNSTELTKILYKLLFACINSHNYRRQWNVICRPRKHR